MPNYDDIPLAYNPQGFDFCWKPSPSRSRRTFSPEIAVSEYDNESLFRPRFTDRGTSLVRVADIDYLAEVNS